MRVCLRSIGKISIPNHVMVRKQQEFILRLPRFGAFLNYIGSHLYPIYGSPVMHYLCREKTVTPVSMPI